MIGEIRKIDEIKSSRNPGTVFKRVYFNVFEADGRKTFAKTDLVNTYRNYKRWKDIIETGNILSGLIMRGEDTVDADSYPVLIKRKETKVGPREKELKQQKLL